MNEVDSPELMESSGDAVKEPVCACCADFEQKNQDLQDRCVLAESNNADLREEILSLRQISDSSSWSKIYRSLTEKVRKLENENQQLLLQHKPSLAEPSHAKVAELHAENIRLKASVIRLQKEHDELLSLREELLTLRQKLVSLDDWKKRALLAEEELANDSRDCDRKQLEQLKNDTKFRITTLERENELQNAENGKLTYRLAKLEEELIGLRGSAEKMRVGLDQKSQELQSFKIKCRSLDLQAQFSSKQAQLYTGLSNMIMSEENMQPGDERNHLVRQIQAQIENVRCVTERFIGQQECIRQDLDRYASNHSEHSRSFSSVCENEQRRSYIDSCSPGLKEKVAHLRESLNHAEASLENLREENEALKLQLKQLGFCDDNSENVLHMTSNPFDFTKSRENGELKEALTENHRLKQRMEILQSRYDCLMNKVKSGSNDLNVTQGNITMLAEAKTSEAIGNSEEIKQLKEELKAAKLSNDRIMEVFRDASSAFHHAVFLIFGCRVDLRAPGVYRIQFAHPHTKELLKKCSLTLQFDLKLADQPWKVVTKNSPYLDAFVSHKLAAWKATGSAPYMLTMMSLEHLQTYGIGTNDGPEETMAI